MQLLAEVVDKNGEFSNEAINLILFNSLALVMRYVDHRLKKVDDTLLGVGKSGVVMVEQVMLVKQEAVNLRTDHEELKQNVETLQMRNDSRLSKISTNLESERLHVKQLSRTAEEQDSDICELRERLDD